jgi:hypothetical protein
MRNNMCALVTIVAFLFPHCVKELMADPGTAEAARDIMKANQDAIVWVTAVVKTHYGGEGYENEQKSEILGTVISESGLTVVSCARLDSTESFSEYGDSLGNNGDRRYTSRSDLSDIKIVLADATEIPAKLVLKDSDLDLAFVVPDDSTNAVAPRKFAHVTLEKATKVSIADDIVCLIRLDRSLDKQPAVSMARVVSIVRKPRMFYVGSTGLMIGAPVFTMEGKVLGISVMRGGRGHRSYYMYMPVILPAEDVMEIAEQALEAKAKMSADKNSDKRPKAEDLNKKPDEPQETEP